MTFNVDGEMTFGEYQNEALKTLQPDADRLYPAVKVGIEGSEYAQHVVKNVYHGKPLSIEFLIDEAGDVLWYLAVSLAQHGITLGSVAELNIAKLRKRHGESYNPDFYQGNGAE